MDHCERKLLGALVGALRMLLTELVGRFGTGAFCDAAESWHVELRGRYEDCKRYWQGCDENARAKAAKEKHSDCPEGAGCPDCAASAAAPRGEACARCVYSEFKEQHACHGWRRIGNNLASCNCGFVFCADCPHIGGVFDGGVTGTGAASEAAGGGVTALHFDGHTVVTCRHAPGYCARCDARTICTADTREHQAGCPRPSGSVCKCWTVRGGGLELPRPGCQCSACCAARAR